MQQKCCNQCNFQNLILLSRETFLPIVQISTVFQIFQKFKFKNLNSVHKNSQSRPQIHYPPTREDNSWAQGIGKANEFRRRKPGELDPVSEIIVDPCGKYTNDILQNDARRKISDKKSSRSPDRNLKKRPKLERVRDSHRDSIDSDKRKSRVRIEIIEIISILEITQQINKLTIQSRSKTKDRWDLHRDYEHSMKRKGKRKVTLPGMSVELPDFQLVRY